MDSQEYVETVDSNATDDGDLDDLFEFLRGDSLPQLISLTAVLGALCVAGCVGNSIVITVLCRSVVTQTSTQLITTLAITDLIIASVAIPGVLVKNWAYPFYNDAVCKAWEFIRMTTVPMSALILMVIAFDRYFLICVKCYRDKSKTFLRVSAVCVVTCSIGLGVPPSLAVGVYQWDSDGGMEYLGLCMPNFLIITPKVLDNYWRLVTALMVAIFLIVITLYSMVFIKVYKQSRKWNSFRQIKIQPARGSEKNLKAVQDLNINQTCNKMTQFTSENNKQHNVFKNLNVDKDSRQNSTKKHSPDNREMLERPQDIFLIKVDPCKRNNLTEKPNFKSVYPSTANPISVFHDEVNSKNLNQDDGNTKSQDQSEIKQKFIYDTKENLFNKNPGNAKSSRRCQSHPSIHPTPILRGKSNLMSEDKQDTSTSSSHENSQINNSEQAENKSLKQSLNKIEHQDGEKTEMNHSVKRHHPVKLGQHRAHIKTAKVLLVVTIVYFVSYCPTFLMSCDVISDDNLFLFYSYFLHSAANPIIYSFMNKQFRQAVTKLLFGCKKNSINLK